MQNNTSKILIILLILAICFASYQTFRLQKATQSENNLKLQFSGTIVSQDKLNQQLQDAYSKITLLKEENAHLMLLLDEQRQQSAEQEKARQERIKAQEEKANAEITAKAQEEKAKSEAEELKKRTEAVLGIYPE